MRGQPAGHSAPEARAAVGGGTSSRPKMIRASFSLFDPLKREAIYQFFVSGNLHAFEKVMGQPEPCLVGRSGNHQLRPVNRNGPRIFYPDLIWPLTALHVVDHLIPVDSVR